MSSDKKIKLLVLLNGKMVKLPPYSETGKVFLKGSCIGAVFSVSKDVYKTRRDPAIKKLLVGSVNSLTLNQRESLCLY